MTLKNALKSMAVISAVAIAAPGAYAAEAYMTIGGDSEGPIFPVYGQTATPAYDGTAAPIYDTAVEAPVGAAGPDDGYTNIGGDSGGPVFNLHAGALPEYGPAEEVDSASYAPMSTVAPLGYSQPATGYDPAARVYGTAVEQPVGAPGADDGYTNIGTDSGGPIFNLHAGSGPEYGPAEEVDTSYSTGAVEPVGYSAPATYYVPARDESGSPLIPAYR